MTTQVPMLVLGGFLGAGKTTLLNRILTGSHGVRTAVLVNDFGELDVDGALVTAHDGDTVRFANGCLCCALGDDLVGAVDRLLANEERPPERFVVEASGVADPAAIADVATLHPGLVRDLVTVLADVETLRSCYEDRRLRETIARQLDAADLLVLNKCDRVGEEERAVVTAWAHARVRAPITHTVEANVPVALLLDSPTAAAAPPAAHAPEPFEPAATGRHQPPSGAARSPAAAASLPSRPGHGFRSRTVYCPHPIDPARLRPALAGLMPRVLRAKGFLVSAGAGPDAAKEWTLVQACGRTVHLEPWHPPRDEARPAPTLVFIGLDDLPTESELVRVLRRACRDVPLAS